MSSRFESRQTHEENARQEFAEFYIKTRPKLRSFLNHFASLSVEHRDDITEQSFLQLWIHVQSEPRCGDGQSPLNLSGRTGYLFRIARNLAVSHHRSRSRSAGPFPQVRNPETGEVVEFDPPDNDQVTPFQRLWGDLCAKKLPEFYELVLKKGGRRDILAALRSLAAICVSGSPCEEFDLIDQYLLRGGAWTEEYGCRQAITSLLCEQLGLKRGALFTAITRLRGPWAGAKRETWAGFGRVQTWRRAA